MTSVTTLITNVPQSAFLNSRTFPILKLKVICRVCNINNYTFYEKKYICEDLFKTKSLSFWEYKTNKFWGTA